MRAENAHHELLHPASETEYAIVTIGRVAANADEGVSAYEGAAYKVVPVGATADGPVDMVHGKPVVHGYLVPSYERTESEVDVSRRDIGLLANRVQKFFYSARPGLDIFRTREELAHNIERLTPLIRNFRFDKSLREHSAYERTLIEAASQVVGQAVNRLGALGKIIIQGNRDSVRIEYDDNYIASHMDDINREFFNLWQFFSNSEEGQRMCDCVLTREGLKDRDGVFAQLIRETIKPVMGHIRHMDTQGLLSQEHKTIRNLVYDIGATMLAVDETAATMHVMLDHPFFGQYVRALQRAVGNGTFHPNIPQDLDLTMYRGMVREYIDLTRARASIRSEDALNFDPLDLRLKSLQHDIDFCHQAMTEFANHRDHLPLSKADKHKNNIAKLTVPMLERGLTMITEMAELRLPRNRVASGIDGRESSVEHYHEKVTQLLHNKLSPSRGIDD